MNAPQTCVVNALARFLAQPVSCAGSPSGVDAASLAAILRRGDVLLTEGVSRMAALVKRLTRSPWSHVAMYVGVLDGGPDPRCVVEADIADGVRAVPLSEFKGQRVRVLRPTGLHDADKHRLADWLIGRIGHEYDVVHAWRLARRMFVHSTLRLPLAHGTVEQSADRYICSSLLAQAFERVGYSIVPVGFREVPGPAVRYVTPSDFENASGFDVVPLTV